MCFSTPLFNICNTNVNILPCSSRKDVSCAEKPAYLYRIIQKWSNCKEELTKEHLSKTQQIADGRCLLFIKTIGYHYFLAT
jgi:hypothetical protein